MNRLRKALCDIRSEIERPAREMAAVREEITGITQCVTAVSGLLNKIVTKVVAQNSEIEDLQRQVNELRNLVHILKGDRWAPEPQRDTLTAEEQAKIAAGWEQFRNGEGEELEIRWNAP